MMYTGKHFNVLYMLVNLLHDVGVWTIVFILLYLYIILFIYAGIHRLLDIGTYIYIYIPGNSEDTFSPIARSTVWAIYREYVYINIRVYIYIYSNGPKQDQFQIYLHPIYFGVPVLVLISVDI
jgi:hypothetical protein